MNNISDKLLYIANGLDDICLYKEANQVDNIIPKLIKQAEKIIMYHGTSAENLDKILSQGFITDRGKERVWHEDRREKGNESKESYPGIYFTQNYGTASSSAQSAILEQTKKKPAGEHPYETGIWRSAIIAVQIETRSKDVVLDEDLMESPHIPVGSTMKGIVSDWYKYSFGDTIYILTNKMRNWGEKHDLDSWTEIWMDSFIKQGFPKRRIENLRFDIKEMISTWFDYQLGLQMEKSMGGFKVKIDDRTGNKYLTNDYDYHNVFAKLTEHYHEPLTIEGYGTFEYDDPDSDIKKDNIIRIINNFMKEAMGRYRKAVDNFLRKAKEYVDVKREEYKEKPERYELKNLNVRVTEPVGFKGANRILVAIEIIDDKENRPTKIKVRYNKDNQVLNKMLAEFKDRIGSEYEIIS